MENLKEKHTLAKEIVKIALKLTENFENFRGIAKKRSSTLFCLGDDIFQEKIDAR